MLRGNTRPQPRSHSKLKQPQNIRHEKMSKDREDLHLLHRSLRAQGEGESSSHLEDLHQAISQLVDEEENLLQLHMDSIQENAQLLTEEGNLLAKVQGEDVVDYDIDVYAERLDRILERKITRRKKHWIDCPWVRVVGEADGLGRFTENDGTCR